jgi:hypothetical protein
MRTLAILAILAIIAALALQPPALLAGSPISPPVRPQAPPERPTPPAQHETKREGERERPAVIVLDFALAEDTAPALVGQGAR